MDLDFYGECCSHETLCLVNDSLISVRTRAVESDFRKSNKSRMPKSLLSDFSTGRKPWCQSYKRLKKYSDAGP